MTEIRLLYRNLQKDKNKIKTVRNKYKPTTSNYPNSKMSNQKSNLLSKKASDG